MIDLLEFLHSFIPLINSHSNDFLVNDLYNLFIPDKIRCLLSTIDKPEYVLFQYMKYYDEAQPFDINCDISTKVKWDKFKDPIEGVVHRKLPPSWEMVNFDLDMFIKTCAEFGCVKQFVNAKNKSTSDIFVNYAMKEKKSYEVKKMSSLCREICINYNITSVVDIGSGKGYLGSELSIFSGLDVVELDSKESNSTGALDRRKRFAKHASNVKRKMNITDEVLPGNCRSIVKMITANDTISKILIAEGYSKTGYLLTGLHCCGGLSSTILKNFVQSSDAQAVAIVGCCYHLLNEQYIKNFANDSYSIADFPMSQKFLSTGIFLGRNAKSFASHSIKRVIKDPQLPINMFHRILLQKLLQEKLGFVSDNWILGNVCKNITDFEEYVRVACKKLGINEIENMTKAEIMDYETRYPRLRHEFTCFFNLKCCLAAIIENIVICDRLAFLKENGISNAQVLELFDEVMSPRRYVLIGVK